MGNYSNGGIIILEVGFFWRDGGAVVDERQKSQIEKRKRNLTTMSPVSRREREMRQNVLNFREDKKKSIFFAQASRVERDIFNTFLQFREEKENITDKIL